MNIFESLVNSQHELEFIDARFVKDHQYGAETIGGDNQAIGKSKRIQQRSTCQ